MFDLWLFVPFKFNQSIILKSCFFLNQYNRHFFFQKIFNSNPKLVSTKNNQSIDQSTNTILKYLSLSKKGAKLVSMANNKHKIITQTYKQFNNPLSSLSTFNHLLLLLQLILPHHHNYNYSTIKTT